MSTTGWTFTNLVEWANSCQFTILPDSSTESNKLSAMEEVKMEIIQEWPQFDTHFETFKKLVRSKFEKSIFNPIEELKIANKAFSKITCQKNLQTKIQAILNPSLLYRIFARDSEIASFSEGVFQFRSDNSPTFSDMYFFDGHEIDVLIAEVKTDLDENLKDDYKSEIYSAFAQIASDLAFSKHSPKVAILTTYNKTWIVQLFKDKTNRAYKLLISPIITRENFFQAIYFVFSLLFEKIRDSICGWSDYVNTNKMLNDDVSDKKCVDTNVTWPDLLYDSEISQWKVIGSGLCGVVCHASIREHNYAIKKCSLAKSPKFVLDELKNESEILMRLQNIKEVSDFVPSFRYYGSILLQQLLVCDFIVGHIYDSFDEMDQRTKVACLERVKQLHVSNVLHGDLRAYNFIVQLSEKSDNKVFVIDFGRSEILEKNASVQETKKFKKRLVEEMKQFKSHIKLFKY